MPKGNPPLIDMFVYTIMNPAVKKPFIGAPYITFQRYLGCYQIAFETGVILGYAFRDRLLTFAKLFSEAGREKDATAFIKDIAQRVLNKVKEPKDFLVLGMSAEKSRIEIQYADKTEERINRQKFPPKSVFKQLQLAMFTGIGFGSSFPWLTEQLWRLQYEHAVDSQALERLKKAGLNIPDQPYEPVSLATRQAELHSMVEQYVSDARPDLLPCFQTQQ
ncbi:MAG TPA: hypothetical protein VN976_23475 [Verrucomicrobiae bacterium]|nr:hypothetical protein [Verrucomicrobiae bacterium]